MPKGRYSRSKRIGTKTNRSKWDYLNECKVQGNTSPYDGKTTSELITIAQRHFNKYIRLRDQNNDGTFTCKACGNIKSVKGKQYNAGHLFSVASSKAIRFDERNVHGICVNCNYYNENHVLYLAEYVKKTLGEDVYEDLLRKSKMPPPKWARFELIEIIEKYKELCKNEQKKVS